MGFSLLRARQISFDGRTGHLEKIFMTVEKGPPWWDMGKGESGWKRTSSIWVIPNQKLCIGLHRVTSLVSTWVPLKGAKYGHLNDCRSEGPLSPQLNQGRMRAVVRSWEILFLDTILFGVDFLLSVSGQMDGQELIFFH